MLSHEDMVRYQADHGNLIESREFRTLEAYCLFLLHLRAYEEAGSRCVGLRVLVPADPGSCDVVTSFQVIEHGVDVDDYVAQLSRVLAPGGCVLLTTPNAALRLDPGMRPWNSFHARECRAAELAATQATTFANVEILGLTGGEDLAEIERGRARRALEGHRRRLAEEERVAGAGGRGLRQRISESIPTSLLRGLRGQSKPEPLPPLLDAETLARYSSSDFFYRTENLDEALDLMAICR